MIFLLSSCAFFKPTKDQQKCFRDTLSGEVFRETNSDEKSKTLESMEDRRQITIDINSDRYEEKSCIVRDQFKTHH